MIQSRDAEKVGAWLSEFPNLKLVTRDSSYTYDKAIRIDNSEIIQVADRFHLCKNITDATTKELKKIMPKSVNVNISKNKIEEEKIDLNKLSEARQTNYLRKKELFYQVKSSYEKCGSYTQVAKEFSLNIATVRKYISLDELPIQIRTQQVDLDEYLPTIKKNIAKKTKDIYEILKKEGYTKSYDSVAHYIRVKRLRENAKETNSGERNVKIERRTIEKLLFNKSITDLTTNTEKQQAIIIYLKENQRVQKLINCVTEFRIALFSSDPTKIEKWIEKVKNSELADCISTKNIEKELDAVKNNINYPMYSNGIVEGKNTKVKYIKRSMYGRCSFELLRLKVLACS